MCACHVLLCDQRFLSAFVCQLTVRSVCVPYTFPVCLQLAFQRGMLTEDERDRVFNVMTALGLRLWDDVCTVPVLMKVRSQCALVQATCWLGAVQSSGADLLHSLAVPSVFWLSLFHIGCLAALPSQCHCCNKMYC